MPQPSIDNTAWTLASLPGATLPAAPVPTLRFDAGRVQGSDGCNRYAGSYSADDGRLQLGPHLVSTQMACPEPAQRLSAAFNAALAQVRSYRSDGAALTLLDAAGSSLASLAAQANGLAGTAWQVGAYNNGKQAVVSLLPGTTMTLAFLPEGRVGGSAGCNSFSGSYTVAGDLLSLSRVATTRRLCGQPDGLMAQEAAFLSALETAATARRERDRLELRSATGALAATLTLVPAPKP
ncbi:MAG TPA: META domain-containing protein [Rubrivivax sp.]